METRISITYASDLIYRITAGRLQRALGNNQDLLPSSRLLCEMSYTRTEDATL